MEKKKKTSGAVRRGKKGTDATVMGLEKEGEGKVIGGHQGGEKSNLKERGWREGDRVESAKGNVPGKENETRGRRKES